MAALACPDPQAAVAAAKALIEHGHGSAIQHLALHLPKIASMPRRRAGDRPDQRRRRRATRQVGRMTAEAGLTVSHIFRDRKCRGGF